MVINFFVYESNYCDMWTYYLDLATILMRKKYMELLVLGIGRFPCTLPFLCGLKSLCNSVGSPKLNLLFTPN